MSGLLELQNVNLCKDALSKYPKYQTLSMNMAK